MDSSKRAQRQKGTTCISKQRLVSACFFLNFNLALSSRLLFGSVIYSTGSKATKKIISHHVGLLIMISNQDGEIICTNRSCKYKKWWAYSESHISTKYCQNQYGEY